MMYSQFHRIQHCKQGHADIGKHRLPKRRHATKAQEQDQELRPQSQDYILPDNPPRAPSHSDGIGYAGKGIGLEDDIGALDSRIASQSAHRQTDIAQGQGRSIVHSVADESGVHLGRAFQVPDVPELVFGQQVAECLGDAHLSGKGTDNLLLIPRKYLYFFHAEGTEPGDG